MNAFLTSSPPKIDGILNEEAWKMAIPSSGFVQYRPYNGPPASFETEIRFLYDNSGIYVGATMADPYPDSIPGQLGLRDADNLNADYFELMISPFNDGINANVFRVYVSDVQMDYKIPSQSTQFSTDVSWDAVWESKAMISEKGWIVEMKIPYSAIRFPKTLMQNWGLNCSREIRRYRELSTWNFIDSKIDGLANQEGLLEGIRDVKPSLRLSLSPYVSGYLQRDPGDTHWDFSYNLGADLKYGINQSFTLDMTLIPDFGQVPADDKIYNFSPFEVRYQEKRQFFTEGTELFNRSGIFYSRRVGAEPKGLQTVEDSIHPSEKILKNPTQTRMINATKISGRTNHGLGIGFFNGMTSNTWADIEDTITGNGRKILTQGFTNYNMIVFDQALKNNSYFDILNTNYYTPGIGYCANVTGIDFKFAGRKNIYALTANAFISQKYITHTKPDIGYRTNLSAGKISGHFLFIYTLLAESDKYDPNDMGYDDRNNKFNNNILFSYNIYEPFGRFIEMFNNLRIGYNCLYSELKYTSFDISEESFVTNRKHVSFDINFYLRPAPVYDYYEPRVPGYLFILPADYSGTAMISTDYRKKLAIDANLTGYFSSQKDKTAFAWTIAPRFRASNRLFFTYSLNFNKAFNDIGYVVDSLNESKQEVIIFGKRNVQTIINVLRVNFMVNSRMSIDLRIRHYWVLARYSRFYTLRPDGYLDPSEYAVSHDINYNLFNTDLTYVWNFAPGSQLSLVWKNAINTFTNTIDGEYVSNFQHTLDSPSSNSISLKLLYYLDAQYLRKKSKKS